MGSNGTKPTFDFSEISWGDSEDITVISAQLSAAQAANDAEGIKAAFVAIRAAIARMVTYVPREWFVKAAPEPLDFADPETYRYLKRDKFQTLMGMAKEEQSPLDSSGK